MESLLLAPTGQIDFKAFHSIPPTTCEIHLGSRQFPRFLPEVNFFHASEIFLPRWSKYVYLNKILPMLITYVIYL